MVAEGPEDSSFAGVVTATRTSKKWRDKLFSRDKNKLSRDDQVDDFLAPSRTKSQQHPFNPRSSPRIDVSVSQRWPESSNDLSAHSSQPSLDFPNQSHVSIPLPKKKRNVQGLKVAFTSAAPVIIGEGGDEADAPTKEISLNRARSYSSASAATDASYPHSENVDSSASGSRDGPPEPASDPHLPSVVVHGDENPASGQEEPEWKPPLIQNTQDSDFLLSIGSQPAGSRISLRASGDPNSFARRIQARMRAEEGLALQKARSDSETELPSSQPGAVESQPQEDVSHPPPDADPQPEPQPPPHVPEPSSPPEPHHKHGGSGTNFWTSVLSSLPNESRSLSRQDTPPSSAPAPDSSAAAAAHSPTPPPPYLKSSLADAAPETPPHNSKPSISDENRGSSHTAKKSWRSVTNLVGDSALTEFSACVEQYNELFSYAAEDVKPSRETSLEEWVKATVWWFLKGRGELEASLRSRSSGNPGNSSPGPTVDTSQQGVVNLAKAWWINQHIIPQHPELEKFGKISTDAMLAVAKTTGDQRMSNLIGLHQTLLSHLRALAMSMKRNNILPAAADQIVSDGTDTSIWVKYPFFTPDISAVLSGSVSKSMVVDPSSNSKDIADMMPLGDTSRYFCYGRMFVEAHLTSQDDESQEYIVPCMLSITRDRTDWHVIASITSQNELVNIVIQSDKRQRPTWSDVEWQLKFKSMCVRLPRAFELDVRFQDADFKTIWKIVEYTRKTEESLRPEPGEKLLFENVLKVFQYMDSAQVKAFPPEPTQRCRIRVFERSVKITEGWGTRQSHRGFRFTAVTSPKVKTLSCVSHLLGNGAPIVFGYLRGEDGAPALLLKVHEDGRDRSMLLTFHEPEDRSKMHSFLLGVATTRDELKTKEIPMRSFSMEQLPSKVGLPQASPNLQFSTSSCIVINNNPTDLEHGFGSTVLSEHLRVFINSSCGSVTDRINLSKFEITL